MATAAGLTIALSACSSSDGESVGSEDPTETAAQETTTAMVTEETPTEAEDAETSSETEAGRDVTLEEAEQAALDHVGEGEVTWSGPEDDRGAAWEVEVTLQDGSEVDVLVAADGSIVKQVEKYTGTPETELPAPSGELTLADAEQIAVAAVGGGEVTWSGDEDERGARWEIEVTRPDGSEVDVLVDAEGNVVS